MTCVLDIPKHLLVATCSLDKRIIIRSVEVSLDAPIDTELTGSERGIRSLAFSPQYDLLLRCAPRLRATSCTRALPHA